MTHAHATTDHQRIKQWVEQRGGHPAAVASTGEQGILRVDFEPPDESLEPIDWDTFFETFERKELAFLYQDTTNDGSLSRFNKFIERRSAEANDLEKVSSEESTSSTRSQSQSKSASGRSRRSSGTKSSSGGGKRASAKEADSSEPRSAKSAGGEEINVNDPEEVEEEIEDQLDPDQKE